MNKRLKVSICLVLGGLTFALYSPSLTHDFIYYDDQQYVTENSLVRQGLTLPGVFWAFGYRVGNWHPLTWLSHMLDCQLYGLHPAGHHLTNVLLHVGNSLLLLLVLHRLTGALWRSAAVAAAFAWHPLHVESVAWVAERKDLLSSFFFMLTLWTYNSYTAAKRDSGYDQPPGRWRVWYLAALLCYALGLMSKPMLVTLPFILLLLDFWPLSRERGTGGLDATGSRLQAANAKWATWTRLTIEKMPFLLLSAAVCALTLAAQEPALASTRGLPVFQRVEHALAAYAHYVGALWAPRDLAVFYPYEKLLPSSQVVLAMILLASVSALVIWQASRRRYLVTGWLWFLGMLVPVIGLVQVGDQAWPDRYSYLPSVGLFLAVVWLIGDWVTGMRQRAALAPPGQSIGVATLRSWFASAVVTAPALTAAAALMACTTLQLSYWKNTRTLFEHTARFTHNNSLAATLLGSLLAKEGKLEQAMEHYRAALRYTPDYPEAHFLLGHAFDQQGSVAAAIAEYRKALSYKPSQEQAHIFLGAALAKQKDVEAAAVHYRAALQINPDSAVAHNNLAKLLHAQGRLDEAITHYSAAVRLDPSLSQAHNNLGILLLQTGKLAEGAIRLREALRLNPNDRETQVNLAQALAQQGQWREAADFFGKAVTAATADPHVRCQYATTLAHLGRTREAMSQYAAALLLQQDLPEALDGLSWILATNPDPALRNAAEAVHMSERACELTSRKEPVSLRTLAAAYAEAGRFPDAVIVAQAALALARQGTRPELADKCRQMVEQFTSGRPWRE